MKKKTSKFILKVPVLAALLIFSALNLSYTISQSISDTNQLTFIKDPPAENYILRKFAYITGGVKLPGVYELNDDDIKIADLIEMAGGLNEDADTEAISKNLNLASIVKDSDHINIPIKKVSQNNSISTNSTKININTATAEQLDSLPGIGAATAQKIINARPFSSIEDIKNVSGLRDSKFNQIKDLITTE